MARAATTRLGVCRLVPNPGYVFGPDDAYFHVVVDSGGGFRHLVLTLQQYAECQARAERGLNLVPDLPWYRKFATAWRTFTGKN